MNDEQNNKLNNPQTGDNKSCQLENFVRRFLPSNGTDGMIFIDQFCSNCIHEKWMHHQDSDEGKCEILSNSMIHNRPCYDKDLKFDGWEWFDNGNFDDYPKNYEWKCNQFKYWDWGNDRDGWNEPPEPVPYDPNQLLLFSFDEKIDELIKENVAENA